MPLPSSYRFFDHASGMPVREEALAAYLAHVRELGNPGSVHRAGQQALAALDAARAELAAALGVLPHELIATATATEANNLAILGTLAVFEREHPGIVPRIVISAFEHDAVRVPVEALLAAGRVELAVLPATPEGGIDVGGLEALLDVRTALVSLMHVSNELGSLLPVYQTGRVVRAFRGDGSWPRLHSDAVQALAYVGELAPSLGADLATYAAHKVGGVPGAAVLVARDPRLLEPQMRGGGQERGLRAGTEDVAALASFACAASLARREQAAETARLAGLRSLLLSELARLAPEIQENVSVPAAPHILSLHVPHGQAQVTVTRLDLAGFAISAGPACSMRALRASRGIAAMGLGAARAEQSARVSFGPDTDEAGVRALAIALAG